MFHYEVWICMNYMLIYKHSRFSIYYPLTSCIFRTYYFNVIENKKHFSSHTSPSKWGYRSWNQKINLITWLIYFVWKDLGKQHFWMQYQEDWDIRTTSLVKCTWMGVSWRGNSLEIASLMCHRLILTFIFVHCAFSHVKKVKLLV